MSGPGFYRLVLKTQLLLLHGDCFLADTIAVCRGHVIITKPRNMVYGVLGEIKWGLCLRPTSRVTKGQVQMPVPKLPFSLLWRFFNEWLLQSSSLVTPPQHIVCLQEVN